MVVSVHFSSIFSVFIVGVVAAMFSMMVSMFYRWGSSTYKLSSAAFAAVLLLTVISIVGAFRGSSTYSVIQADVSLVSFVLLQWGTYKFFFPKKTKEHVYFAIGGGLTLLAAVAGLFLPTTLAIIVSSVLGCLLTALAGWWIFPQYKKRLKFLIALGSFAAASVLQVIASSLALPGVLDVSLVLSAVYYFSMFLLLFERLMDVIFTVSHRSVTDGLTGLYLKKYFIDKTQEALNSGEAVALIFSDIDNFKILNDTQGHQVGDTMLKFVGNILQEVCQDIGIVGRYGGEEMVALITDPEANLDEITERFRYRVEMESPAITPITVSVGYSRFVKDVSAAGDFIREADQAMYSAKKSGKNRVMSYQA